MKLTDIVNLIPFAGFLRDLEIAAAMPELIPVGKRFPIRIITISVKGFKFELDVTAKRVS